MREDSTMRLSAVGLIVTFGIGLLVAPLVATAQQPGHVSRIGVLSAFSPPAEPDGQQRSSIWDLWATFWQGMRELGWREGQNIVVEYRWAERRFARLPALATELVQRKVDVILVGDGAAIVAAKKATSTIPIVMMSSLDAVEQGFVASLAHPGGNVTGLTTTNSDLNPKRLELLKETVPGSSRIAVLACKIPGSDSLDGQGGEAMQVTARALGVQLQRLEVREPDDYEGAFAAAISEHAEAMFVAQCYFNLFNPQRIVVLAAKYRLPAIYSWRGWVQGGGLMSYGPSLPDLARRAATYVDKILKGAKPTDLPVEQPMKFELVINLKTAQALGLTIPPTLLMLADEVIR
jgi:putative tryptophan/tyrosine transport system substrate-binding protein